MEESVHRRDFIKTLAAAITAVTASNPILEAALAAPEHPWFAVRRRLMAGSNRRRRTSNRILNDDVQFFPIPAIASPAEWEELAVIAADAYVKKLTTLDEMMPAMGSLCTNAGWRGWKVPQIMEVFYDEMDARNLIGPPKRKLL
jgi:hypothetical protein